MADFLTTIARERRERLEREALHVPTVELRREAEARSGDSRAFGAALRRPSGEPLRVIAEKARARDTGARGLRSIVEEIMTDIMFELPDLDPKGKYIVTEKVVRGEQALFDKKPVVDKKSA